jgi:hypothetical protein
VIHRDCAGTFASGRSLTCIQQPQNQPGRASASLSSINEDIVSHVPVECMCPLLGDKSQVLFCVVLKPKNHPTSLTQRIVQREFMGSREQQDEGF